MCFYWGDNVDYSTKKKTSCALLQRENDGNNGGFYRIKGGGKARGEFALQLSGGRQVCQILYAESSNRVCSYNLFYISTGIAVCNTLLSLIEFFMWVCWSYNLPKSYNLSFFTNVPHLFP